MFLHHDMVEDLARSYREERLHEAEAYRRAALVHDRGRKPLELREILTRIGRGVVTVYRVVLRPSVTSGEVPFGHAG